MSRVHPGLIGGMEGPEKSAMIKSEPKPDSDKLRLVKILSEPKPIFISLKYMATNLSIQVESILALRPTLRPASDELRKRVQSIRVRSGHETGGRNDSVSWRSRQPIQTGKPQDTQHVGGQGRWRTTHTSNNVPAHMQTQSQHQSQHQSQNSGGPPFRFTSNVAQSHTPQQSNTGSQAPTINHAQAPVQPTRYVSRFHNGSKIGDDQILNTVILNKLNVFSVKTYDDVKGFLFQILGSDQREFVREFTWLVFRKAAAEDKYCSLFARLLADIQKEYPVILEEVHALHTTYLDIWDATETKETKVDKKCRLGYSQFLAELTALQVLDAQTISKTLETLKRCIQECVHDEKYKETVEEYFDCLRRLCCAKISYEIHQLICSILQKELGQWIAEPRESVPGLSSKSRFACMDLLDLLTGKSKNTA